MLSLPPCGVKSGVQVGVQCAIHYPVQDNADRVQIRQTDRITAPHLLPPDLLQSSLLQTIKLRTIKDFPEKRASRTATRSFRLGYRT